MIDSRSPPMLACPPEGRYFGQKPALLELPVASRPVRRTEVWVRWFIWRGLQLVLAAGAAVAYYVSLELDRQEVASLQSRGDDTVPMLIKIVLCVIIGLFIGFALKDFSKVPLRFRFDLPTGLALLGVALVLCVLAVITEHSGIIDRFGRVRAFPAYFYSPWTFPYIWFGLALTGFLQVTSISTRYVEGPVPR